MDTDTTEKMTKDYIAELPEDYNYLAPDGSEIRKLVNVNPFGGLAHCRLPPGKITKPIHHRRVEELWFCLSGNGELWRHNDTRETTDPLNPGTSVVIGFRERFQFRCTGNTPLELLIATIPSWPGPEEAVEIARGEWEPTISP